MKKLMLGTLVLLLITTNASAIVFNESTSSRLDAAYQITGTNTHVDIANGLEWLDFGDYSGNNVTFGFSVNAAAAEYSQYGFTLATETQVAGLFDLFYQSFADSGNGTMVIAESETSTLIKERNSWLVGFGTNTPIVNGQPVTTDIYSTGLYVADDGSVQIAGFKIAIDPLATTLYSTGFTYNGLDSNTGYSNMGVFMVRDYIPAVPVPAAVWLMLSGLLGLVAVARRRTK